MDKFTDTMLGKTGLIAMVGKAWRGSDGDESIRASGGTDSRFGGRPISSPAIANRVSLLSKISAWKDLQFEVKDMPVTVAVVQRTSVHDRAGGGRGRSSS
jgi:fumarate hydratase class I